MASQFLFDHFVGAQQQRLGNHTIVVMSDAAAEAAKQATSTIPIILVGAGDPVGIGLIASLARPGGNITGTSAQATVLSAKRLEILKEAAPTATRVAVLYNADNAAMTRRYQTIEKAASTMRVTVQPLGVREPDDFEVAFSAMTRERPDALIMTTDTLTLLNRKRVIEFTAAHRIPAIYEFDFLVQEGGLMAYGPSDDDIYRRTAIYVDKITKPPLGRVGILANDSLPNLFRIHPIGQLRSLISPLRRPEAAVGCPEAAVGFILPGFAIY